MKSKLKDLGCVVWLVLVVAAAILGGWFVHKALVTLVWMPLWGTIVLDIIFGIVVLAVLWGISIAVLISVWESKISNFDEPDDPDDP